jgi:hypothetical protein
MVKKLEVKDNMLAPAGPGAEVDPSQIRAGEREKSMGTHEKGAGLGRHGQLPTAVVRAADEESINFASILKGTAANRMTLFEKKAALINAELDQFGFGKYQICIWFLCGESVDPA